jgi:diguanylate cyclase (GGDEF)-like protein
MTPNLQHTAQELWSERHTNLKGMVKRSTALLQLAKLQADSLAIGLAYRNLGFADLVSGQLESAWHRLTYALETSRRHHAPDLGVDANNFLAGVYRGMGQPQTALVYLENALRILRDLQKPESEVPLRMNIGILLHDLGRHQEAVSHHQEALEILQTFPNPTRQLEVNSNLAMSLLALKQTEDAKNLFLQSIQQAQNLELPAHEVRNLVNLGEAHSRLGQHQAALEVLQQALDNIPPQMAEGKIYAYLNIAQAHRPHTPDQALLALEEAQRLAVQLGIMPVQVQISQAQYQIHKAQNNHIAALEAFERHFDAHNQLRQEGAEQELRLFTLERDFEKTVAEAEINRLKNEELGKLLEELKQKTFELETLVKQDPLTSIYNRRFLEQTLENELQHAKNSQQPLAVAVLDVDNFKRINDNFSHAIGDQVLQAISYLMRLSLRGNDVAARYGGEEFVLALPNTTLEHAELVCERLRLRIANHNWTSIHPKLENITVSIGISNDTGVPNHEKLLDLADRQMYIAKRTGKNRVVSNQVLTDTGLSDYLEMPPRQNP